MNETEPNDILMKEYEELDRFKPRAHGWSTEPDKEWIARGGHKGIYLAGLDFGAKDVQDLNLRSRQVSPELAMWQDFFTLLVQDAMGISPGVKKICTRCHSEQGCGCYQIFQLESGEEYTRKTKKRRCPLNIVDHSIQQCAIRFINEDPLCEEYCGLAGISVTYLRRYLSKGEFKGNAFDKKRETKVIRSNKALHHSRRPGASRSPDRPPEVGGEIHRGETS